MKSLKNWTSLDLSLTKDIHEMPQGIPQSVNQYLNQQGSLQKEDGYVQTL